MHRQLRTAAVLITLAIAPHTALAAQEPQTPPPARAETRTEPRAEAAAGQPVNIKLDLTITDQNAADQPRTKTVTLVIADRATGSIRSTGTMRMQGRVQINVDARPQLLTSGAIRLNLSLEYNPQSLGAEAPAEWSALHEQIGVVLEPGKPLVISQAADPASDRRITVEIRATMLK